MKRSFFILVVAALIGLGFGYQPQNASSQVELPLELVAVPGEPQEAAPVSFVSAAQDVCVDGSCSTSSSGSACASSSGPVRRVVAAKPVRRVVGRVFCRLRGCR